MNVRRFVSVAAVAAVFFASSGLTHAQSEMSRGVSDASTALSVASGLVVAGSALTASAAGNLSVEAIRVVGESTVLVLRGIGSAAEVSVQISSALARDLSIAVGTVVRVVADGVGYAFMSGARMVAYIPNEAGRSLLHHARLK